MKNKIKLGLIFLIVLLTLKGAAAFWISDNFNDNSLSTTIWVNKSRANMYVEEANGVIQFNGTNTTSFANDDEVYLQTKQSIPAIQDGSVVASIEIENLAGAADVFIFGITNHVRGGAWVSTPPAYCGIYFVFRNGDLKVAQNYPTASNIKTVGNYDGDPHNLRIDVVRLNATNMTSYSAYYDDVLQINRNQSNDCNDPVLNVTFAAGGTLNGNLVTIWVDDFYFYSTEAPDCDEPCIKNESFNYDDSLCNHNGWVAGDCDDLNTPVNSQYICNGSSQVLAKYFGKITKDSGFLTLEYDLEIKSNYEVLFGFGSQEDVLAVSWFYNDGNITELKDNTNIGNYSYNTTITYKVIFDLEHKHWDFYMDDVLQHEDIEFYDDVDNLYYFFIQPDYNRGSPYCDYILDNVVLTKAIALIPTTNESYWQVGEYLTLDPQNASFDWDLACRQNEHPTLCFYRSLFEDLLSMFTNFVFSNFLLWLVLIVVVLFVLMIKQNKS